MSSFRSIVRYCNSKIEYTKAIVTLTKAYEQGEIADLYLAFWKTFLLRKFTFLRRSKGLEMAPTIGTQGGTLLVRRIPKADATNVYVGDMVMLKDPMNSGDYLVRRLAAVEGYEMASTDEKDEPFVLEKNDCWVLAENNDLKPKDSYDSRTFGPVSMTDIVGRVIYCLRDNVDHGAVKNSNSSVREDHLF